jgi:hypothetical protein
VTAISLCSTNLLFPFVTSAFGFDTGIAISNTSSDPFLTANSGGTCALNFYGSGVPTPSTGVVAPGGTQATGTVNSFLLSSVAPNFTGYVIAQCQYQYGHGFAYIINGGVGNPNSTAMGYVAEVLGSTAAAGRGGTASETITQ